MDGEQKVLTFVTAGLMGLVLAAGAVYGICWGAWWLVSQIPADVARLWALLASLALPLVAVGTWKLALRYERGVERGLDLGAGAVAKAGADAVRAGADASRGATRKQPAETWRVLPEVEITSRRRLPADGDVIDL